MNKLWIRRAPVTGFPAASANLVWVATRKHRRQDVPSLRAYDPDGRLVWFTPGHFTEPAIAYERIYLAGPERVLCLEHDPQGAPFRNLRLARAGRARGEITLQVVNTGFVTERNVVVVADTTPRGSNGQELVRSSRQRFRIPVLEPGEQAELTLTVAGEKWEPGKRYVSCFIARPSDPFRGDNHLAFEE